MEGPFSSTDTVPTPGADAATPSPAPPAAAAPASAAPPPQVEHLAPGQNDQVQADPLEKQKADSWGTKVYHGILNALGGSSDVTLARDPQTGKMVATAVKSGPGQQWKRIISGAITGVGAAEAGGGTGPGSTPRKFGLGIQGGAGVAQQRQQQQRQDANEDFEMQQKAATSNAQNALLSHQIAESTFRLGRQQVDASVADTDRETNFTKLIAAGGEGSQDMGVFPDFASVVSHFKKMPQLHDHQAQGQLVTIPHVNGQGKVDGVHVALVTPDWMSSKLEKDLPITTKSIKDGKVTEDTFTIPSGSITNDQAAKLLMAQSKDALDEHQKKQTEDREAGRAKAQDAKDYAEGRKADAEARKADADAKMWTATDEAAAAGSGGGAGSSLVDMIGTGHMNMGRLSYLAARKPELLQAVAKKYPGFDDTKVAGYLQAYKEYASTKPNTAGGALNSGSAVLKHLRNLAQLNTVQSHIPGTNDYTAYHNQLETLVPELGKFYGNDTIPGLEGYRKTLGSTLPGNRMAAIKTQAHSMSNKFDSFVQSWKNVAPSKVYEARMPGIDPDAISALKELDPEYPESKLSELVGAQQVQAIEAQQTSGAGQVRVTPGEPTAIAADGKTTLVVRGGQWVPAIR